MSDDNSNTELQDAFFNDGYRIAAEYLSKDRSVASFMRAMEAHYSVLDSFIKVFLERAEQSGTSARCDKGCAWCCHQTVFAETHTIRYLVGWISKNLSETEKDKVHLAARNKEGHAARLPRHKRLMYKYPCPLLSDNTCMAYAGRPVSCRIYLSSDVASCRHEYEQPEDRSVYPQLFAIPLELGRKLNEGFASWLQEHGEEIDEYPLEEGILKFMRPGQDR